MKNFRYIMLVTLFGSVSLNSQAEANQFHCKVTSTVSLETESVSKDPQGDWFVIFDFDKKRAEYWTDTGVRGSAEFLSSPGHFWFQKRSETSQGTIVTTNVTIYRITGEFVDKGTFMEGTFMDRGVCELYEPHG
ncbi:hypothetical protein [Hyphomonas sp.]|jgi:hypothetical protein|uniref:hypothetical protein n=1 Tax=Hyphomonas sp. TaxID=87 RepID=UPI0037C04C59